MGVLNCKGPKPPSSPSPPTPPTPEPVPTPSPSPAGLDTLLRGQRLQAGEQLISAGGTTNLALQQSDGNLVLYHQGQVVWASGTTGQSEGLHLDLQGSDGNLVLYGSNGAALWASGNHEDAIKAVLHDDCDLVVVSSVGGILWSLGTSCPSARDIR